MPTFISFVYFHNDTSNISFSGSRNFRAYLYYCCSERNCIYWCHFSLVADAVFHLSGPQSSYEYVSDLVGNFRCDCYVRSSSMALCKHCRIIWPIFIFKLWLGCTLFATIFTFAFGASSYKNTNNELHRKSALTRLLL